MISLDAFTEPAEVAADNGYAAAKARAAKANERASATGKVLDSFPKGAMGLTTDEAKATLEWKRAKADFDKAFADVRAANSVISKNYAKESRARRKPRDHQPPETPCPEDTK